MKQIDWSEAPEGCTHYLMEPERPNREYWVKQNHGLFYFCRLGDENEGFRPWLCDFQRFIHSMVIRPDLPQQWNGEGLPPVGLNVEVLHAMYGWIGAKVVGADGSATIVRTNDGYAGVYPHEFRPIRTAEQVAADEREAAIKKIGNLIASVGPTFRDQATRIYDAGYRKTNA